MQISKRTKLIVFGDTLFLLLGIALLLLLTTVYLMPFRLDDVLHIDWAHHHTFWDAFDPVRGEIVRSFRPLFASTIWLLTHYAGMHNYFPWHFTLVASFFIALAYTGMTARYLSGHSSSLYISILLFWFAFFPILNVLFWFGDLTFSIELMFTAPAWYYGIRGLREGRIGMWFAACLLGVCAVLSKEPALLLVHSVFVGIYILERKNITEVWLRVSRSERILATAFYIAFLVISLVLYFSSPTKSNRFFHFDLLSTERISFFVWDRIRYYSESLLHPAGRLFLVTPLITAILFSLGKKIRGGITIAIAFLLVAASILLSFFFVKSIITFSVLLLVFPFVLFYCDKKNNRKFLTLLPFSISAVITLAVLEITVMLVKTQLTELAFLVILIAGIAWSVVLHEVHTLLRLHFPRRNLRRMIFAMTSIFVVTVIIAAFPILRGKESLLREVRDTRYNANNAVLWMASHLPHGATVLVGGPQLFNITREDDLTSKDDELKSYGQYTFLQGYVRFYFENLGRGDLLVAYLEDRTMLHRVLDSFRETRDAYLFLQTGMERDTFHGQVDGRSVLSSSDSLLAQFNAGKYPSEVWKL